MQFQREAITSQLIEEIEPLLRSHYDEIAHYKDIGLDPYYQGYVDADQAGILRLFTARDEGKLVGYAVFIVKANLHYVKSLQAVQDIFFLDKAQRGKLWGSRFLKWCDERLRAENVQVVYHHVKKAHDFGPMLERLGYELVDFIYGRRLD